MSDIQFEDSNYRAQNYSTNSNTGLTSWLVKKGWVKNEAAAEIFLFIVAIIFFALAAMLFFNDKKSIAPLRNPDMELLDAEANNI